MASIDPDDPLQEQAPYQPPKRLRLLIAVIVVLLIIAAFALSWLTMPHSARNPPHPAPSRPASQAK